MAGSPEQQEPIGLNSGYLTHQRQERWTEKEKGDWTEKKREDKLMAVRARFPKADDKVKPFKAFFC